MKVKAKSLFNISVVIAFGIIAINAIIYWHNTKFGFSVDILSLAVPVVAFTWITAAICGAAMHLFGRNGSIASAIILVSIHVVAIFYSLFAMLSWREGAEYAQLFVMQLTFSTVVVSIWAFGSFSKSSEHEK